MVLHHDAIFVFYHLYSIRSSPTLSCPGVKLSTPANQGAHCDCWPEHHKWYTYLNRSIGYWAANGMPKSGGLWRSDGIHIRLWTGRGRRLRTGCVKGWAPWSWWAIAHCRVRSLEMDQAKHVWFWLSLGSILSKELVGIYDSHWLLILHLYYSIQFLLKFATATVMNPLMTHHIHTVLSKEWKSFLLLRVA